MKISLTKKDAFAEDGKSLGHKPKNNDFKELMDSKFFPDSELSDQVKRNFIEEESKIELHAWIKFLNNNHQSIFLTEVTNYKKNTIEIEYIGVKYTFLSYFSAVLWLSERSLIKI